MGYYKSFRIKKTRYWPWRCNHPPPNHYFPCHGK